MINLASEVCDAIPGQETSISHKYIECVKGLMLSYLGFTNSGIGLVLGKALGLAEHILGAVEVRHGG